MCLLCALGDSHSRCTPWRCWRSVQVGKGGACIKANHLGWDWQVRGGFGQEVLRFSFWLRGSSPAGPVGMATPPQYPEGLWKVPQEHRGNAGKFNIQFQGACYNTIPSSKKERLHKPGKKEGKFPPIIINHKGLDKQSEGCGPFPKEGSAIVSLQFVQRKGGGHRGQGASFVQADRGLCEKLPHPIPSQCTCHPYKNPPTQKLNTFKHLFLP